MGSGVNAGARTAQAHRIGCVVRHDSPERPLAWLGHPLQHTRCHGWLRQMHVVDNLLPTNVTRQV